MLIKIFSILLLLTSCAVGPDYKRPETVKEPEQYKEGKIDWQLAKPNSDIDRGEWWKIYQDSYLNDLEDRLNKNNQDVISAEHSYKASLTLINQARASYLPNVSATANVTTEQDQENKVSKVTKSHGVGVNYSWGIDLWGNLGYTLKANIAAAEASKANWAAIKLSMQASLAQYYFELRDVDKSQVLLDEIEAANKKLLEYTKNRYKFGIMNKMDVQNAENNYQTAKANALSNQATREQYQHAIAVLVGESPSNFVIKPTGKNEDLNILIPLSIPSTLLERRPDVAQSEELVKQANAQIGSAIAAFFPSLSLAASTNISGQGLGKLLSMPTLAWSLGPQVNLALFDGGLTFAKKKYADENYQQTVASYRKTVLAAFQQVEDQLALLKSLEAQTELQKKNAINSKRLLKHTIDQYNSGIVDSSGLLNAQIAYNNAEKVYSYTISQKRIAEIGLIQALGGGWKK